MNSCEPDNIKYIQWGSGGSGFAGRWKHGTSNKALVDEKLEHAIINESNLGMNFFKATQLKDKGHRVSHPFE